MSIESSRNFEICQKSYLPKVCCEDSGCSTAHPGFQCMNETSAANHPKTCLKHDTALCGNKKSKHDNSHDTLQKCLRGLRSMKCSSKTLQNLLYFMYKKTHVLFSFFILCNFIFLPYEYPGLCRHRPGHS